MLLNGMGWNMKHGAHDLARRFYLGPLDDPNRGLTDEEMQQLRAHSREIQDLISTGALPAVLDDLLRASSNEPERTMR